MKKALLLVLLILAAQPAAGYEEIFKKSITESGVYEGSGGRQFPIQVFDRKVIVDLGSNALTVRHGECERSGDYQVCLKADRVSHVEYVNRVEINVTFKDVTISERVLAPELEVSREFEKTEFWKGQETLVSASVRNVGDAPAEISYSDRYPNAFRVLWADGCSAAGNAVTWRGTLERNRVHSCEYRIRALEVGATDSRAEASFAQGRKASHSQRLTVRADPLRSEIRLNRTDITLGDVFRISVSLSASEDLELERYRILLKDNFGIVSSKGFSRAGSNWLEYEGIVTDDTLMTADLRAERTGSPVIAEEAEFEIIDGKKRLSQSFEKSVPVNVSVRGIEVRLLNPDLAEGEKALRMIFANLGGHEFSDLRVEVKSGVLAADERASLGDVPVKSHRSLSVPLKLVPGEHEVGITVRYRSEYGQEYVVPASRIVTVPGEPPAEGESEEREEEPAEESAPETAEQESAEAEEQEEESASETAEQEKQEERSGISWTLVVPAVVVLIAAVAFLAFRRKNRTKEHVRVLNELYKKN